MKEVHDQAADDERVLRLSFDAKATVKVGPFSRQGKSRISVNAADHDFKPDAKVTPFAIYLPEHRDIFLYMTRSKVTPAA